MQAANDGEGKAGHVIAAFCGGLQIILGHEASRGKGFEIPGALRLFERLGLRGKIITGAAIIWQKSITAKFVEGGGDYVFPVKDNQKSLKDDIETAFNAPVFPLSRCDSGVEKAHGRIGQPARPAEGSSKPRFRRANTRFCVAWRRMRSRS